MCDSSVPNSKFKAAFPQLDGAWIWNPRGHGGVSAVFSSPCDRRGRGTGKGKWKQNRSERGKAEGSAGNLGSESLGWILHMTAVP